jgi:hypothetical protein
MELISPGLGLIVWQMFVLLTVILFIVSWASLLTSKTLNSRNKLSWLLGTLFLPILGPILFFVFAKRIRND